MDVGAGEAIYVNRMWDFAAYIDRKDKKL